jgi:hypothetical protein
MPEHCRNYAHGHDKEFPQLYANACCVTLALNYDPRGLRYFSACGVLNGGGADLIRWSCLLW